VTFTRTGLATLADRRAAPGAWHAGNLSPSWWDAAAGRFQPEVLVLAEGVEVADDATLADGADPVVARRIYNHPPRLACPQREGGPPGVSEPTVEEDAR